MAQLSLTRCAPRTSAMVAICCVRLACAQAAPTETVAPADRPDRASCFFAGREATLAFEATNGREALLRVQWSLSAGGRRLSRGVSDAVLVNADEAAAAAPAIYSLAIPAPPLRPGVVLAVGLQLAWTSNGQERRDQRQLYLYSPEALEAHRDVLERARIKLFDPDGATALVFDDHHITHMRLASLAAIDSVAEGVLVVGEGVDFSKHRGLAAAMIQAARRGVPVLCLAPSAGDIPLAAADGDAGSRPAELVMGDDAYIRRYDKRFDLSRACALSLKARSDQVAIGCNVVGDASRAMDMGWLVLTYAAQTEGARPNKLIVCGAGVVSRWEASPVPQYLLIHMLRELTEHACSTSVANSITPSSTGEISDDDATQ